VRQGLTDAMAAGRAWATRPCSGATASLIVFTVILGLGVVHDVARGRAIDASSSLPVAVITAAVVASIRR